MIKMFDEMIKKSVADMKKDFDGRIDGLEVKIDRLEGKIDDMSAVMGKLG